jgi:hypothetical protein
MKKDNTKTKTKKHKPNNGVTTQWLIELSESIWNNSWVHTTMLSSDGIDMLIICFKDINGDLYPLVSTQLWESLQKMN